MVDRARQLSIRASERQQQFLRERPKIAKKIEIKKPKQPAPVQQSSQLTKEQIEAQQKIEGQKQVKEIDKLINEYQEQFNKYDEKFRNATSVSSAESADRERERFRQYVSQLQGVKNLAESGQYDFKSVVNYATSYADAVWERTKPKTQNELLKIKEYEQKVKEYNEAVKQQNEKITEAKKQGLTPIYAKGILTGFEDKSAGKSVALKDYNAYIKEKPEIQKKTELAITQSIIPKENQNPVISQLKSSETKDLNIPINKNMYGRSANKNIILDSRNSRMDMGVQSGSDRRLRSTDSFINNIIGDIKGIFKDKKEEGYETEKTTIGNQTFIVGAREQTPRKQTITNEPISDIILIDPNYESESFLDFTIGAGKGAYDIVVEKTPDLYLKPLKEGGGLTFKYNTDLIPTMGVSNIIDFTPIPDINEKISIKETKEIARQSREKNDLGYQRQQLLNSLTNIQNKYISEGKLNPATNEFTETASEKEVRDYETTFNEYNKINKKIENLGLKEKLSRGIVDLTRDLYIDYFPETVGELGVRAGEVYAGGKLLKGGMNIISKIPKAITTGADIYLTYEGTKVLLEPTATPKEAVMGAGVIGLAGFSLLKELPAGIKFRKLTIPTDTGGVDIDLLGIETKSGRALTLGAKTPKGIKIGTPKIEEELSQIAVGKDLKIGSALETKAIEKALSNTELKTERAQDLIPILRNIVRETRGTKSKFIDTELLKSATERLPRRGVKEVIDIAKERKGILFGSKSREFQLAQDFEIGGEQFKLNKVPRDVELRFDNYGDEKLQEVTEETIRRLKKLGKIEEEGKIFDLTTAREIKDKPFTIEAKVDGKYEKVAEFKGKEQSPIEEEVPEYVLGIKKTGKPMKVDNLFATKLEEELRGVAQGVARVRKTPKGIIDILPPPKRLKDIGSVSVSARTLEMSKPSTKLKKDIESFESLFPKDLVKEQVRKVVNEPVKNILADFSESKSALSKIGKPSSSSLNKFVKSVSPKSPSPKSKSLSRSVSTSRSPASEIPSSISSPSISTSPSASFKPSPSISKSPSPSLSPSPSISPSPSTSPSPSVSPPRTPTEKIPNIILSDFEVKPLISKSKQGQGYNVYVKEPKTKRIVKVNRFPINQRDAENLRNYLIDQTTSRTGYLKNVKGKPKPLNLDIPRDYGQRTDYKFRRYKIKKGKRVPLENKKVIEKTKYLLDEPSEKKQINIFKKLAQLEKRKIKRRANRNIPVGLSFS